MKIIFIEQELASQINPEYYVIDVFKSFDHSTKA